MIALPTTNPETNDMNHSESQSGTAGAGSHAQGADNAWLASDGRHGHMVGIPPRGQAPSVDDNTVTLDSPIWRGETVIDHVTLRRPKAGELRGISLTDLLQLDVAALQAVLPRITSPMLLKQDVAELDPADLVQLGTKVAGFLLPRAALAESPTA